MPKALAAMTMPELQAEFVVLGNQVSVIDGRRRAIDDEMDRRKATSAAKAKINSMTADEVDALKDELGIQR